MQTSTLRPDRPAGRSASAASAIRPSRPGFHRNAPAPTAASAMPPFFRKSLRGRVMASPLWFRLSSLHGAVLDLVGAGLALSFAALVRRRAGQALALQTRPR